MAERPLGDFQFAVLACLDGREPRGYDVLKELEATAMREVVPGNVYTTLRRLADKGLVRERTDDAGARHYALTPTGRRVYEAAQLRRREEMLTRFVGRVSRASPGIGSLFPSLAARHGRLLVFSGVQLQEGPDMPAAFPAAMLGRLGLDVPLVPSAEETDAPRFGAALGLLPVSFARDPASLLARAASLVAPGGEIVLVDLARPDNTLVSLVFEAVVLRELGVREPYTTPDRLESLLAPHATSHARETLDGYLVVRATRHAAAASTKDAGPARAA